MPRAAGHGPRATQEWRCPMTGSANPKGTEWEGELRLGARQVGAQEAVPEGAGLQGFSELQWALSGAEQGLVCDKELEATNRLT